MERPEHANKKRIEKKLLYPDGTQRTCYLSMVDDKGAFCYMLDTGVAEHMQFHSQAALIALYESERDAAQDELFALKKLYSAQEDYIDKLTSLVKRCVKLLDDAIVAKKNPNKGEKAELLERKRRLKLSIARAVVLDDE